MANKIKQFNDLLDKIGEAETLSTCNPVYGESLLELIGNQYRFESYVWKGGEAILIKAYDLLLRRLVAIKCALPYMQGEGKRNIFIESAIGVAKKFKVISENDYKQRFLRGAMIQAELQTEISRPGIKKFGIIPAILETSEYPLFVVMEYIDGQDSLTWAKRRTFADIINLFRRVLLFVDENIHGYGVVHSDLKPANIMVREPGWPVVVDFTICKDRKKPEDNVTRIGHRGLGTPFFSSPQVLYDSAKRSIQDDIFALGRSFYCMVARRPPEDVEPGNLVALKDIVGTDDVVHVYMKATALEPDKRYTTIKPFLVDLEATMKRLDIMPMDSPMDTKASQSLKRLHKTMRFAPKKRLTKRELIDLLYEIDFSDVKHPELVKKLMEFLLTGLEHF